MGRVHYCKLSLEWYVFVANYSIRSTTNYKQIKYCFKYILNILGKIFENLLKDPYANMMIYKFETNKKVRDYSSASNAKSV